MQTQVIFRQFRDGEVIALFPYEPYNRFDVNSIESYMHIGQHSEADYSHIIKNTKPIYEYNVFQDLYNELESLGYELEVIERRNLNHAQKNLKENFDY